MTPYDSVTEGETGRRPIAAELFAGVGGFHLALDRAGFDVVWSNQWEPATKAQHAFECYQRHVDAGDFQLHGRETRGIAAGATDLGLETHLATNDDIAKVLDQYKSEIGASKNKRPVFQTIPTSTCLSVASHARTIRSPRPFVNRTVLSARRASCGGRIYRLLRLKLLIGRPIKYLFLENVDRLIKSPTGQRGRDFAVMLASLADLGYEVEWRVINAADYGFPQKRRRVFIIGRLERAEGSPRDQMFSSGVLARALPLRAKDPFDWTPISLDHDVKVVSDTFNLGTKKTPFGNAGVMRISAGDRAASVWTHDVRPAYVGERATLADILEPVDDVPAQFFVEGEDLEKWQFLKGAKSLVRISRATGIEYTYDEGPIPSRIAPTGRHEPS